MMTNDDERGEGVKKYRKYDDGICERPLTTLVTMTTLATMTTILITMTTTLVTMTTRGKNLSRFLRPKIAVPRQAKVSKIAALSRQKS